MLSQIKKHPLLLGTILLTGAGFFSRILGFFYRIFLSHTIGASGLGLYQLIFPIFSLGLSISASGIQTAISRFIAEGKASGLYLRVGLTLSVLLAALLGIGVYHYAPWIACHILEEPRTEPLLSVMSLAFIPASIHACFNGYYYGKKSSIPPSICQISEQLARILSTWIIYQVLLENHRSLEPIHAVWALFISECTGQIVNMTTYLLTKKGVEKQPTFDSFFVALQSLGCLALPLTLNHLLMTLSHSLEHLLLPQKLVEYGFRPDAALSHFGIFTGMSLSVILFPSAITNSLSVLILPKIAEAKAQRDQKGLWDTIRTSISCGMVMGALCTFVFLLSGNWFGTYVFQNHMAGYYIQILSILCPFLYTSNLLSSIVNGLGFATHTLACNLSGCAIRLLAICFYVPYHGMYAYMGAMIFSSILVTLELVFVIKRKL